MGHVHLGCARHHRRRGCLLLFTDGNFAPKDAKLEYLAEDGQWHEVPNVSGLGIELDRYNTTSFDPITTTKLRMTMEPEDARYRRHRVEGLRLRRVRRSLRTEERHRNCEGHQHEPLCRRQQVSAGSGHCEGTGRSERYGRYAGAGRCRSGGAECGHCRPRKRGRQPRLLRCRYHELLLQLGVPVRRERRHRPFHSYNPSKPRYGTWGNRSSYETVTYTWGSEVIIDSTDLYLWYDGTEGEYTSGGILVPKSVEFEYLDAEGNWKSVPNAEGLGREMDKFNETTFDSFTTTALRVKLNKQSNDSNGVGIMEWKVYGKVAGGDTLRLR